jgi:hypothetical protein
LGLGRGFFVFFYVGAGPPHDSITCFWARAEYPSWQRLAALETAESI